MIFRKTELEGVLLIEPERIADARGHFSRTWCHGEFESHGLDAAFVQCNTSFNHHRGTLRGLHYQAPPHEEGKLIRCTRGRLFDVAVDVRVHSATRGKWCATELSADNGRMVFIPGGCAHGFQTLEDATEIFYQMTADYVPDAARGLRWDDPTLAIDWPVSDPIMSERDLQNFPYFGAIEADTVAPKNADNTTALRRVMSGQHAGNYG